MDFSFSQEQNMLQESIERFVQNDYGFDERQKNAHSDLGFSQDHWQTFAELGWLGVPFAESDGGFGGGAVEASLMMEQFGRGLVIEPFLATVVLAGGALKHGASDALKARYLPGVIDGSLHGALAYAEPQARFNLADTCTTAAASANGFVLNGQKAVVLNGPRADFLVISARTFGEQRDRTGISLFVVDAKAAGVTRRDFPTVDAFRASEITLENVSVDADSVVGAVGEGYEILEQVIDEAIVSVGAEAVGCMEKLYKETVEYCKQREQFGQPIGKFQVLQHRMVDMFMEHEQAKSLMFMAAMRMDEGYGPDTKKAVSAFKVQVGKSGKFVGQSAVQLHGGMGMTEELSVGHYFKRLTIIDTLFGNSDYHLKRFGAL